MGIRLSSKHHSQRLRDVAKRVQSTEALGLKHMKLVEGHVAVAVGKQCDTCKHALRNSFHTSTLASPRHELIVQGPTHTKQRKAWRQAHSNPLIASSKACSCAVQLTATPPRSTNRRRSTLSRDSRRHSCAQQPGTRGAAMNAIVVCWSFEKGNGAHIAAHPSHGFKAAHKQPQTHKRRWHLPGLAAGCMPDCGSALHVVGMYMYKYHV